MRNANYNYNPKKRGKFYRVVNIIVMTAFLFNMTATQGLLMLSPGKAQAASGSIWTTKDDCGDDTQDVNHFDHGQWVYINGENFDEDNYLWEIKGQPGGASGDPDIGVEDGDYAVDETGSFCFPAYQVNFDDWGEYKVGFGGKNDNYRVDVYELPATIVAHKIVCSDEADLPNWGTGEGSAITSSTAQDWVDSYDSCEFASGWDFQWRVDVASNHPDYNPGDNTGKASGIWTTFGTTDVDGVTSTELDLDLADRFWFREVWQDGYIPFTFNQTNPPNNSNNVSAELYCNTDVINYDNLEWIDSMQPGGTYNCVAWNVLEEEPTYDLHGYKWNDENGDGIWDDNEETITGWGITLDGGDPVYTNDKGKYWFLNLLAGEYEICEVQQAGWTQTSPANDECHTVILPSLAAQEPTYNFGNEHDKGDLTIVKYDHNGQLMDGVEFKIDGVASDDYITVNGTFTVEDVLTGYHIVEEMDIPGYTFTSVTGENCTNSNPSAANVLENGTTCSFINTRDTGELSGMKFNDLDADGSQGEGEEGLSGWTINIERNLCSTDVTDYDLVGDDGEVNLSDLSQFAQYMDEGNVLGDMNSDGVTDEADFTCFSAMYNGNPLPTSFVDYQETDAQGEYLFTDLIPGSYNIWETQDQQGWMQTSSPEVYTILITAGMEVSEVDFGNYYVGFCGDEVVNNGEECDYYSDEGVPENYSCTRECLLQEDPYYLVQGYKYEDLDGSGDWDEYEQPLNDWEICYAFNPMEEVNDASLSLELFAEEIMEENNCVTTGSGEWSDGYYEIKFYNPGHVTLTETQQAGYTKTEPVEAGYEIELAENPGLPQYNFGNQPDFAVSIEKSANVSTIGAGEQFTYTVNWGTSGIITADDAVITDTLPTGVNFVSATDSGVYDNGTHTVTWTLHDVAPETTGSFGITVQTLDSVNNNDQLVNNVEIMATKYLTDDQPAEATALVDPVLTRLDRSATASSTVTVNIAFVGDPLLTITKDASVDNADAGDTISYTVVVANNGTATATNVMVDDTLPAGMTFVDSGLDTVTLVLGDIIAGDSETVTYDVKVADTATTGSYENLAEAYANNHAKVSDSAIVAVTAPIVLGETTEAELALTKSANVEFTNPGGTVEYTLTIANNGTEDAQNVVMTDQLPEGFVFEGTTDAMKVWNFSTIAMGSAETVTYNVTVSANAVDGKYENVALATADNSEDANASASVEIRAVSVLGELVDTGTSARDYMLYVAGIMLIVSGIWFFTRNRKLSHHSK
jgi:uncharacterized repeat protein (TIGR01451 family)